MKTTPSSSFASRRRGVLTLTAAGLLAALPGGLALAQGYPDRPVKVSVGFPPGTGPDTVARIVGIKLSDKLKQPVTVENRAGAGGQIAAQLATKTPADGYNVLLAEVGSISIAPSAFENLRYDPLKELVAVTEVARANFLLVVPAHSPYKTVEEFVSGVKGRATKVNFATFGAGTPGHFGAELFATQGGFKIEPVHYRSTGDAVSAIISGDAEAAFVTTALGIAQLKGGKMRALATTANQRSALLPDLPTFAEAGLPKVNFSSWMAFFVPTGTPRAIVNSLNAAIVEVMGDAQVRNTLGEAGFQVLGSTQAEAEKMVKDEAQRWAEIVKGTGMKRF